MKHFLIALIVGTCLTALAGESFAKPSLAPSTVPADSADKTVVIKSTTKSVNVFANESVLFKVGDNQFALRFDGVNAEYELASIAPPGMIDHKVKIFVAPDPKDHQQGIP